MQNDIKFLAASIPELENYLLSKELYYPLGAPFLKLTLGNLLIAIRKSGAQANQFAAQSDEIRSRWRHAWDEKSKREVEARRALWERYLTEYKEDPQGESRLYPQDVRNRALLTVLGENEEKTDVFLRSVLNMGKFVWEEDIAQNFERETYWFLYGTPKQEL